MILLIILICVILVVIGSLIDANTPHSYIDDSCFTSTVWLSTGWICGAVAVLALIMLLTSYPYNIDKKLDMYIEENTNIETKIKETVRVYMEYENDTYKNLIKDADLTTLLVKYPELNSNELVKTEIETYKQNNTQIKELKEQQIDREIIGWWLCFNIGLDKEE